MRVELQGNSYELPARTPKIARKFDEFNQVLALGNDVKTHYKACEILEDLLGKDTLAEVFGTSDKEAISTIDTMLAVKKIDDTYLEPIKSYEMEKEKDMLDKINDLGASVAAIERLVK